MSDKDLSYIIPPISRELLKMELNKDTFIRNTNKGSNEIYLINNENAPNTLREIGRLRELAFARSGGGTGLPLDLDEYDTTKGSYEQLIVFSPEDQEIIGGYRFIDCGKVKRDEKGKIPLSTAHYFKFSDQFVEDYLPYTIELGRSWVHPEFQPSVNPRKGLFALDNIWDGLGAIIVTYPHIKYFFGKITMYADFHSEARDAVLQFMDYHFHDNDKLVTPIHPLSTKNDLTAFMDEIKPLPFKEGYRVLQKYSRERNENVPPLFNSYMNLSPTMKCFGTAQNPDFGGVEETGIMVTIKDIYPEKKDRHIDF